MLEEEIEKKIWFFLKRPKKSQGPRLKGLNILLLIYIVKSQVILVYVNYNWSPCFAMGLDYFVLCKK